MPPTDLLAPPEAKLDVYPVPPRGEHLPTDDGEPLESPWHRNAMNLLLETLEHRWRDRTDYYAGGNMFIHFSLKRVFNRDFRGPDVFVVLGVNREPIRKSWVTWEEDGRYPDVVVELVSETTADIDRTVKKALYRETWKTAEYFCYDPDGPRVEGWRLVENLYQPIEPQGGRLWCGQLGLFLGPWDGKHMHRHDRWPRWFEPTGELVPTAGEWERTRAEQEKARAEQEKARADAAEAELAKLKAGFAPPPG